MHDTECPNWDQVSFHDTKLKHYVFLQASEKDATPGEQRLGNSIADTLTRLIAPYFLRRSKAQLADKQKAAGDKADKNTPE